MDVDMHNKDKQTNYNSSDEQRNFVSVRASLKWRYNNTQNSYDNTSQNWTS